MLYRVEKLLRFLLFIYLVCIYKYAFTQNLVINPSFEEAIDFNTANKQGWHKLQKSDTPDYFNFSIEKSSNAIFDEYIGGTKPKSGDGFVGIFCFRISPQREISNVREFIETPLIKTIEKDSLYKVEFSVFLDCESNYVIKNMGVLFSDVSMQSDKDLKLLTIKPQIEFSSSNYDNTDNWITLQAFYKALGTEKYIVIGNFRSDKKTEVTKKIPLKHKGKKEKWELTRSEKASYYYIDDVVVEKVEPISKTPISVSIPKSEIVDTFNINEIGIDSSIVLNNVFFDFNKSDILPDSYEEIDKLLYLMQTNPNIKIRIEGHTDNIGGYLFNLNLSIKRVESVAKYLVYKGISPQRIELVGLSYTYPIASNQTEEGRKRNRRVVFIITEK